MDALFAVEAQVLTTATLVLHRFAAVGALEGRADEIDGRGETVGARRGDDGGAGVEEFGQRGGAGEGEIKGEVFGGEDEAGEEGGGCADGV